jgi:hypothetical protein
VAFSLDIDKLDREMKKIVIGQTSAQFATLKDMKMPDETDAQHQFRIALLDEIEDWMKMLLNDGGELTIALDVDQQKDDLSVSLSLAGKRGTPLAKKFTDLGAAKSIGAGLVGKDSAANMLMHLSLPDRVAKALAPVIDEGLKKVVEDEKDKDKREAAEKVFKVLAPTLKSGEVDFGVNLRGPSAKGQYAVVGALKIKDGAAVEKTLRDLIPTLPEKERKAIKLDFARSGSVNIHRIEGGDIDANAKEMFGEGPGFFAVRDDAIMFAIGDGALEAIKDALAGKPAASKGMQFEVSLNRVAKLAAKENQNVEEAAKKAFGQNPDSDKITLALEGGESLKLRLTAKGGLVTFIAKLIDANKIN